MPMPFSMQLAELNPATYDDKCFFSESIQNKVKNLSDQFQVLFLGY